MCCFRLTFTFRTAPGVPRWSGHGGHTPLPSPGLDLIKTLTIPNVHTILQASSRAEETTKTMPNQSTAHDKRLVALLAGAAAASAAVLLLYRRRRFRRAAAGGLDGRDGRQRNANGARHASYPGDDFNHAGLPPRRVYTKSGSSGSLSDTYPAVDIGAVLGVDIGGTLSKLVYFEKKAPSKADSKRRPSEDPMGKKVGVWATASVGEGCVL